MTSLLSASANGASRPVRASSIALSRAALAASMTDEPALDIVDEPILGCDLGNLVSPIRTGIDGEPLRQRPHHSFELMLRSARRHRVILRCAPYQANH